MQKEHEIFIQNKAENLERQGYIKCAAMEDFFQMIFRAMKAKFPDVECVKKCGPHCLEQIIYLPKFRHRLRLTLLRELLKYKRAARHTTTAIRKIK